MRPALVVIVCVAVSLAVAAVWEIYEFVTDLLLAGTAQGTPVRDGDRQFRRRRTRHDGGHPLQHGRRDHVAIHYLAHLWSKKDLGMGFFKRDFTGTKKAEQPVPHAKEETTAAELPAPHAKEETECLSCNTHAQNAEKNSRTCSKIRRPRRLPRLRRARSARLERRGLLRDGKTRQKMQRQLQDVRRVQIKTLKRMPKRPRKARSFCTPSRSRRLRLDHTSFECRPQRRCARFA